MNRTALSDWCCVMAMRYDRPGYPWRARLFDWMLGLARRLEIWWWVR